MRRVEKSAALELLTLNRRALLGDDTPGCVMCAPVTLVGRDATLRDFVARCVVQRLSDELWTALPQGEP